jgi:hypothetical protein
MGFNNGRSSPRASWCHYTKRHKSYDKGRSSEYGQQSTVSRTGFIGMWLPKRALDSEF